MKQNDEQSTIWSLISTMADPSLHRFRHPEHWNDMVESIARYVEKGLPPGDFIMAMLRNKFRETFVRADHMNIEMMPAWGWFMTWVLPTGIMDNDGKIPDNWTDEHKTYIANRIREEGKANGDD